MVGHRHRLHDADSAGVARHDLRWPDPALALLTPDLQVPLARGVQAEAGLLAGRLALQKQLGLLLAGSQPP